MTRDRQAPSPDTTEVHLRIPASLRHFAGGEGTIVVPMSADGDVVAVGAVLDALAGTHPALERRIRDEQGGIRPHVNLFVGSDNVRDREGPATMIAAGDVVTVIPAVSGG